MRELVALNLEGGLGFVRALEQVWADGDAALPLDPRLPGPALADLLARLRPSWVVDGTGRHRLDGGLPVEGGDALVVATSGTTAAPKGVVLTHDAVETSAYATSTRLGVAPDVRWLACLPLHHVGGLSVVTRALVTGAGLEIHPRFDPDRAQRSAAEGATHVSLVPTALRRLADPSAFRTILLGGSAIPTDRPPNSVATYGMTETGSGVVYDGLPLNGVSVQIADTGEIELRCPMLLRCYRSVAVAGSAGSDSAGSDGAGSDCAGDTPYEQDPFDERGWFRTGDLGSLDRTTGMLTVEGRADEVIITGGEKVWPATVERVLAADPRVADVAVVGRPHPDWGEQVVALVVPGDTAAPPSLDDLRWLVKEELPAHAAPRVVELVDAIPRTALGKVRRAAL